MSEKVDMSEVNEFSDDLEEASDKIQSDLEQVIEKIDKLNNLYSFSGKAAVEAKFYFVDLHKNVSESFKDLFEELDENLNNHIEKFETDVDSSESAIITKDYVKNIKEDIIEDYEDFIDEDEKIHDTIKEVEDISDAHTPWFDELKTWHDNSVKLTKELNEDLSTFTEISDTSDTKELLNNIEAAMNNAKTNDGSARFTDYGRDSKDVGLEKLKERKEIIEAEKKRDISETAEDIAGKTSTIATGTVASKEIAKAAKDKGLSVSKYVKNGKTMYRINASESALRELGVEPGKDANRAFKQSGKTGDPKAPLNYYDKKTGKQVWSDTGKKVLKERPEMQAYNDKASNKTKFKSVGKSAVKGAKDSVTSDLNLKGIGKSGVLKGATKSLGVAGVGLNYYSNYNEAKAAGLSEGQAIGRAGVDTAVDTVVGGAVQAGLTAAGTAFIPIPGVGTAIGAAAGIGLNMFLNRKGKSGKSIMDRTKDGLHKLTGWFS